MKQILYCLAAFLAVTGIFSMTANAQDYITSEKYSTYLKSPYDTSEKWSDSGNGLSGLYAVTEEGTLIVNPDLSDLTADIAYESRNRQYNFKKPVHSDFENGNINADIEYSEIVSENGNSYADGVSIDLSRYDFGDGVLTFTADVYVSDASQKKMLMIKDSADNTAAEIEVRRRSSSSVYIAYNNGESFVLLRNQTISAGSWVKISCLLI